MTSSNLFLLPAEIWTNCLLQIIFSWMSRQQLYTVDARYEKILKSPACRRMPDLMLPVMHKAAAAAAAAAMRAQASICADTWWAPVSRLQEEEALLAAWP